MTIFCLLLLVSLTKTCECDIVSSHGLRPGPKKLERMVVDEKSGYVFIGAMNTIYVRNSNLTSVSKIDVGPRNDSLYCPPNPTDNCECESLESVRNDTIKYNEVCENYIRTVTDAVVKNIILDHDNQQLIVCTSLYYGYCSKISLNNFEVLQEIFTPIVSNSLTGESIALLGPSGHLPSALYVAVTRNTSSGLSRFKNQMPMLAVRSMDDLTIAHVDASKDWTSSIDVQYELRDEFPVKFKYGFRYNGYVYFLVTRKQSPTSDKIASYITRVCENDRYLHSYVELKMNCVSGSFDYNSANAAYRTKLGRNLAHSLTMSANDDVMFVVFSTLLSDSFTLSEDSTGVCMYSLSEIEKKFSDSIHYCSNGFGDIGPEHIVERRKCTSESEQGSALCGESSNWPLLGHYEVDAKAHYNFRGMKLTSVAVKTAADNTFTLGYFGTSDGKLLKVVFESATASPDTGFVLINDKEEAVRKDMAFDSTLKYLYVLTEQKVVKVMLYNCSHYTDCEGCLSARNPHCGWCTLQNLCTEKKECDLGNKYYGWIPYNDDICPNITNVEPKVIPYKTLQSVKLGLFVNFLPDAISSLEMTCRLAYGGVTVTSPARIIVGGVNCTPFDPLPLFPPGSGVASVEPTVWIVVEEENWLSARVKVYDCSRRTSCSKCVSGDLPCIWCLRSSMCMDDRSLCINSSAILSPTASLQDQAYSSADQTNYSFCPRFEPWNSTDCVVAAGRAKNIQFTGHNILNFQSSSLQCVLPVQEKTLNATFQKSSRLIRCDRTQFNYEGSQGHRDYPIQVSWEPTKELDNVQNTTVRVYKCEYLASDCGSCTLLDVHYDCVWCNDRCSLRDRCMDNSSVSLQDICPTPTINQITPLIGPYLGGTNLTIVGTNLGKRPSDVEGHVQVAGVPCRVVPHLYTPPTRVVCVTADSREEKSGRVEITIAGNPQYKATSAETYRYQDPVLIDYSPERGPVSGGTRVTVTGQFLHMGSQVQVLINGELCEVIRRTNHRLEFITTPQSAPNNEKVKVRFDGTKDFDFSTEFAFIRDPRVTEIHPQASLSSGGSLLTVSGTDLDTSTTPQFFVQRLGEKKFSECSVESRWSLLCPLPHLADPTPRHRRQTDDPVSTLDYGLRIDGWHRDLNQLSYDMELALHPIAVYRDPVVYQFKDKPHDDSRQDGMTFEIHGKRLDVFNLVPGVHVTVGNTSCEITQITADMMIPRAPANPEVKDSDGRAEVLVSNRLI